MSQRVTASSTVEDEDMATGLEALGIRVIGLRVRGLEYSDEAVSEPMKGSLPFRSTSRTGLPGTPAGSATPETVSFWS